MSFLNHILWSLAFIRFRTLVSWGYNRINWDLLVQVEQMCTFQYSSETNIIRKINALGLLKGTLLPLCLPNECLKSESRKWESVVKPIYKDAYYVEKSVSSLPLSFLFLAFFIFFCILYLLLFFVPPPIVFPPSWFMSMFPFFFFFLPRHLLREGYKCCLVPTVCHRGKRKDKRQPLHKWTFEL